jgi:hypothetical protein
MMKTKINTRAKAHALAMRISIALAGIPVPPRILGDHSATVFVSGRELADKMLAEAQSDILEHDWPIVAWCEPVIGHSRDLFLVGFAWGPELCAHDGAGGPFCAYCGWHEKETDNGSCSAAKCEAVAASGLMLTPMDEGWVA